MSRIDNVCRGLANAASLLLALLLLVLLIVFVLQGFLRVDPGSPEQTETYSNENVPLVWNGSGYEYDPGIWVYP